MDGRAHGVVGVGAGVHQHVHVLGHQCAVCLDARLHLNDVWRAGMGRDKIFLAAERDLDRFSGFFGQQRCNRFQVRFQLAAKASAQP